MNLADKCMQFNFAADAMTMLGADLQCQIQFDLSLQQLCAHTHTHTRTHAKCLPSSLGSGGGGSGGGSGGVCVLCDLVLFFGSLSSST